MFISRQNFFGLLFISLISIITLLSFQGLVGFSGQGADTELLKDSYFHSILIFSIKQSLLSAVISVILAWPVARIIYYYPNIYAKRIFLSLSLLCFVLPTLVLITGFVSLLGLSGYITPYLSPDWSLYGLQGILLAHVYMNLPFAVRALYLQLQSIPDTSWRLAAQLKFSHWQKIKLIEWPALRGNVSLIFGFIVILCFNSFAVVLALGGGPQSTTLEVAIYQSLKYDFNIPEALTLAWSQFAIAGLFFILLYRSNSVSWLSKDSPQTHWIPKLSPFTKVIYLGIYSITFIFMLLPILSLFPGVIAAAYSWALLSDILQALSLTVALGTFSAIAAIAIAYSMMTPIRDSTVQKRAVSKNILQWLATHTLIAPAMVLSVGLYVFLLPKIDLDQWGMVFVGLLNTLLVLPFAIQQIRPRLLQYDQDYYQLYRSLKLSHWQKLVIEWGYIRNVMLSTFALVLLIAMGDVAIFSIFGTDQWKTLPWLIYQYAGSYRINEASLASAILLLLYLAILLVLERINHHAGNR